MLPTLDHYWLGIAPAGWDSRADGVVRHLPTQEGQCLIGTVAGHPAHPDGSQIATATVVWDLVEGRVVPTVSGRSYRLLEPEPSFAARYPDFDPENPLGPEIEKIRKTRRLRKLTSG